jgi:hypothetical protein
MMAKKKSAKKIIKEDKQSFFVAVNDAVTLRASLLESRKATLESMRIFQSLKDIRKKKVEQTSELRKDLKKIGSFLTKIKRDLPDMNIPDKISPNQEKPKSAPKPVGEKPTPEPKKVEKTEAEKELDRIENELRKIEGKLSGM